MLECVGSRFTLPRVIMQISLPPSLTEKILAKLGFSSAPPLDFSGLEDIYSKWCRKVPFDNVRKLIHVGANRTEPLPGNTAVEFFENWLLHGTGATCWAGNGALYTLLSTLGFDASRGVATMMVAPDIPPNHGTVIVCIGGTKYLVDASILHGRPLKLDVNAETAIQHNAWGVQAGFRDNQFLISWRPLNRPESMLCRLEYENATMEDFILRHEETRAWSPFNYELNARLLKGESLIGVAAGHEVELDDRCAEHRRPLDCNQRMELLIDKLGMSEEIVRKLPKDLPTPPPPWSKTAMAQG